MYSIFLLVDKRMCSPIANECIRIPCTNNLRIPSPQPSRTVSKQNPLRLFRFQITVEICSLTVILVKTGNHQQLMLQALILSQGLATKTCPSMNQCSFPISCIVSKKNVTRLSMMLPKNEIYKGLLADYLPWNPKA